MLMLLASSLVAAQNAPIVLPMDNGKTTSFREAIDVGRQTSAAYFDTLCARLCGMNAVKTCFAERDRMVAHVSMNQWGHGITCTVTLDRRGKYVNYCFDNYRVDSYLLDEWLPTVKYEVAEQIKGFIFARTVLILAEVKNTAAKSEAP